MEIKDLSRRVVGWLEAIEEDQDMFVIIGHVLHYA
jgi:hypothetical protein